MTEQSIDVDAMWQDMATANQEVVETIDVDEQPSSDGGEPKQKKHRTANYKKLNLLLDVSLFDYGVYMQLHSAHTVAESRLDEYRAPTDAISRLSIAEYRLDEVCTTTCQVEKMPVQMYLVSLAKETPAGIARIRAAQHMFLSPECVGVAGRLGLLTTVECERCTVHICSPYCPFSLAQTYKFLYDANEADCDEEDDDSVWNNAYWHTTPLEFEQLPPEIHRCITHNRFHNCGTVCEHMFDGTGGTKVCPISQRAITDSMQNSFGDGVGTAEQQEKTAENKGLDESDNDRRRKSMNSARTRLLEAATVMVNGMRVRRTSGVRSTTSALKRRTGQAKKVTPQDQQKRVTVVATPEEVASCRPFLQQRGREQKTTISAIAQVPFSERTPKYDRQFALDRLHAMYHRVERRRIFTLSDTVSNHVLFGNCHIFATCCERAAAIFHQLVVGRERMALEQSRFDKAKPKAEKAVERYLGECTTAGVPPTITQCISIYEATMSTQTRRFPAIELSAEMYAATESYYAIRAVMFYFGLLSLPVRQKSMMRADEIETIRTAFSFESFCVIIYDLMRTGYTVRNVRMLDRDTFLLERLFPSSSVLKHIGMFEKPCTNIKGLITTILKVAQPNGVSLQYAMDTTMTWDEIAEASLQPDPARRVVEALVTRRWHQLHALRTVRPPSPELKSE